MYFIKKLFFLICCVLPLFLEGCKPVVTITAPANGDTFSVGETITFEGQAADPQHPNLADAAFVWISDKDGEVGTGPSFTSSDLSEGKHTITLTVTDPVGKSGQSSVTITVGGVPATTTTIPTTTTTLSGNSYSLNLSGVTTRQHMQDWDHNWISEVEDYYGNEWSVDPGSGIPQVGVWGGDLCLSYRAFNQFIAAGPAAGMPVRVRVKYIYHGSGTWASCSHQTDVESQGRAHYEVALENGFEIYKYWGPGLEGDVDESIARTPFSPTDGTIYWIYLTERRAGNAVDGDVTITGELWNEALTTRHATVTVVDNGHLPGLPEAGLPKIPSTNKRGFGSWCASDGNGPKILEWHVEDAPV